MIKILLATIFCVNLFANQLELSGTVISDNEKIIRSFFYFYPYCPGSAADRGQPLKLPAQQLK